jgi:uncharacterized protein (TIGR01777 family)
MRVGVLGGTGFLGRPLVHRLVARGDAVTVYSRHPDRARGLFPAGVRTAPWVPQSADSPPSFSGLDALVHLAGESIAGLWTAEKKRRIRESRVLGTRAVVEGVRRSSDPPRILLSGSASGYYGYGGDAELTETSPKGTGFLADLCAEWEGEARRAESYGARVVLLRTSLPLHPSGGLLRTVLVPFRMVMGASLGSGRQWMPWIHLGDWADLALFALDRSGISGPLNLTAPRPATNLEFTRALARVLGRPAFLRFPAWSLRVLLGSMAEETVLVSQRLVPAAALRLGFPFRHPELEPALRDLLDA